MSGFFTFTSLRCSAFDEMSELSFSFDSALSRSGSPSDGASTLSLLSSPFDGGLCPSMKHCPRSSFDSRWSSTAVHCFFPQVGGCSSFKSLSIQTLSKSSFFIENFLWYTFHGRTFYYDLLSAAVICYGKAPSFNFALFAVIKRSLNPTAWMKLNGDKSVVYFLFTTVLINFWNARLK